MMKAKSRQSEFLILVRSEWQILQHSIELFRLLIRLKRICFGNSIIFTSGVISIIFNTKRGDRLHSTG